MGRPFLLRARSSVVFIVISVTLAIFTDTILYSIIVPVLPYSLESRLNVAANKVGTIITAQGVAYGSCIALSTPIIGYISDRIKARKWPYIIALVFQAGATLMIHLGKSVALLIAGRIIQGFSTGTIWCVGLALISDTVNQEEVGQWLGYVFIGSNLGVLAGTSLGGILFDTLGYNAIFVLVYAVVALDLVLRLLVIEKKEAKKWLPDSAIDTPCQTPQLSSIDARSIEEDNFNKKDLTDSPRSGEEANLPLGTGAQGSQQSAMILILKSPRCMLSCWGLGVFLTLAIGLDTVLPLYIKDTFHWSSLGVGLLFLGVLLPSFAGPYIGKLSDKYGRRWFAVAGFLSAVPILVCLRFVNHDSMGQKVLLCVLLTLYGFATVLLLTPLTAESAYAIQELEKSGKLGGNGATAQAYALLNVASAIGGVFGPLWAGFVFKVAGWGTVTWTFGLLCAVSAIPTAIWCGEPLYHRFRKTEPDRLKKLRSQV